MTPHPREEGPKEGPKGRAAEAWARLAFTADHRRRLLPILRAAVAAMPQDEGPERSRFHLAVDALDDDLTLLLGLGCPVSASGFDPMADPLAILEARRG